MSLDSQQDYELLEAKQKPEGFYLLFKRPFSTCDPRDYLIEVCEDPSQWMNMSEKKLGSISVRGGYSDVLPAKLSTNGYSKPLLEVFY